MSENSITQYKSLSKLSSDDRFAVMIIVNSINTLKEQAAKIMLEIGFKLRELEGVLPREQFLDIVSECCQITPSNAHKLQAAAANYEHHYGALGADYAQLRNISVARLSMLGPDTEPEIIEEIKNLALNGSISNATIDKVIASVNESRVSEEKLAQMEYEKNEAEAKIRELELELKQNEHDVAQLALSSRNASDRVAELERENHAMQQDLLEASKKPAEVAVEEVEVLPKRFKTLDEAVRMAEDELSAKMEQKEKILSEIQFQNKKLEDIKAATDAKTVSLETLDKIVADVDTIIAKYPAALISSITTSSPESKAALQALGKKLKALGTQLSA